MVLPVQITYRNLERSEETENWIQEEVAKLDRYNPRITNCRVLIEVPHARRKFGNSYHVQIDLGVPGKELVINEVATLRGPKRGSGNGEIAGDGRPSKAQHRSRELRTKDLHLAIQRAFGSAQRCLREYRLIRTGDVKMHGLWLEGRITILVPHEDCGFLQTIDGLEIYFHRNAVTNGKFDCLDAGTRVNFKMEPGDKGPRATVVRVIC
jgi:cold shock CspA family protein